MNNIFFPKTPLTRSIYLTFETLLVFQFVLFGIFCAFFNITFKYFILFATSSSLFHVFVLILLMRFLPDFIIIETGVKLEKVNLANRITLARLSTLPTILFLLVASESYPVTIPVFILIAAIFLTDFVDGYISRATHQVTKIGKILDSVSDYSLLFFLAIALFYLKLIPSWFFIIVVVRLVIQSILVSILIIVRQNFDIKSTILGKAAVASIMGVFGFALLRLLINAKPSIWWVSIENIGGFIIFISIFDKIYFFIQKLRSSLKLPKNIDVKPEGKRNGTN